MVAAIVLLEPVSVLVDVVLTCQQRTQRVKRHFPIVRMQQETDRRLIHTLRGMPGLPRCLALVNDLAG